MPVHALKHGVADMLQRDIQSRNEFPGAAEYGHKFSGIMNRMSVKYTVAESTGELFKSFDKPCKIFPVVTESSGILSDEDQLFHPDFDQLLCFGDTGAYCP